MRAEGKKHSKDSRSQRYLYGWAAGLFFTIIVAYSNHFNNGLHFDDFHTVAYNVAISKLSNIPQFFLDARTFSQKPLHQTYRPLITTSLAIDFAISQGNGTFWFH